jgi:hypothetical protein
MDDRLKPGRQSDWERHDAGIKKSYFLNETVIRLRDGNAGTPNLTASA